MIAFAFRRRCWLLPACCLLAPPFLAAADSLESVQKQATEWVGIRAETARLETDWTSNKVLLASLLDGLNERATTAEEKRDDAKAKSAKERGELDELREKNRVAAEDLHAAEGRLQNLTAGLLALRPTLPPRLSEALELPYRSLANAKLSAGERMQLATTVLNRCGQFNRAVTCGEEVLTLDGEGGPKSLPVIYWGLSHGYALDRAAGKAWLGAPGPQGWQWEPQPEAAPAVAKLIAVYNDKADPDFAVVPARLEHPGTETARN